jgi:hypothetical protein
MVAKASVECFAGDTEGLDAAACRRKARERAAIDAAYWAAHACASHESSYARAADACVTYARALACCHQLDTVMRHHQHAALQTLQDEPSR